MLSSRDLYRLTKIVTVYVENGLDQPVTVQILGAASSSPSVTVPIGSSFTVPAGAADAKTLVPESSGWLPYITVSLSCSTAPSSGAVKVLLVRLDGTTTIVVNNLAIRDTSTHTYATDPSYISVVAW
ncbi:MAG: hypothetical protein LM580_00470 [Thermofilum sp.]|nr:hypothetical protein [Thermofilum sp.]